MFWGLIMEPQKRYTQTVKKAFHISHAAIDTATGDGDLCQVMVAVDGKNFLMCTLQKNKTIQTPLDLFFREGDKISFITNGKSHVHLTGYLDPDLEEDLDEGEDEDEDIGFEDEVVPTIMPTNVKKEKKRKQEESPAAQQLSKKQKKELSKKKRDEDESKKSSKKAEDDDDDDEDEDEDDSDSDNSDAMDVRKLLEEEQDTDENDDSYLPNESAATVDDSDEDDEDEEEEDESDDDTTPQSSPEKNDKKKSQQQNGHVDKKKKGNEGEKENKGETADKSPAAKEKKVLPGNVAIEDLKVGSGAPAKSGKMIQVFYEGRLKSNNKMFDSCLKNPGFKFRLGKKEVISGWDVGIVGMKVGGKRRIICPPGMAYGNKGSPPVIPPNSTLVFEVELKGVN